METKHFKGIVAKKKYELYDRLLEKGMKGQLVLQSYVTGQLWIDLGSTPKSRSSWSG